MNLLKLLFKKNKSVSSNDLKELYKNGATLIDVRTPQEFKGGNIKKSKNFPLQNIQNQLEEISKLPKPILAVCRSGNRSGMATKILNANKIECYNAGAWDSFNETLKK